MKCLVKVNYEQIYSELCNLLPVCFHVDCVQVSHFCGGASKPTPSQMLDL